MCDSANTMNNDNGTFSLGDIVMQAIAVLAIALAIACSTPSVMNDRPARSRMPGEPSAVDLATFEAEHDALGRSSMHCHVRRGMSRITCTSIDSAGRRYTMICDASNDGDKCATVIPGRAVP